MQRNITYQDRQNARRLRKLWEDKKDSLHLTQVKATKALGINQSAVSQYLNGYIALNTDIALKFAALLQVDPEVIKPDLKKFHISASHQKTISVILTTSGKKMTEKIALKVPLDANTEVFGVRVDRAIGLRFRVGETILIADEAFSVGDEVLVHTTDKEIFIGTYDGFDELENHHTISDYNEGDISIEATAIALIYPIIGMQK